MNFQAVLLCNWVFHMNRLWTTPQEKYTVSSYSFTETAFMKFSRAISHVSRKLSLRNVDYKLRILIRLMAREYFNLNGADCPLFSS
jgi:hypothetical protein